MRADRWTRYIQRQREQLDVSNPWLEDEPRLSDDQGGNAERSCSPETFQP